jgi:DNA-3-methyladenine glycosylase II
MTPEFIRETMDALGGRDPDVARALERVGYPAPRNREPGFAALLNIIVAQQLSTSAAASIREKLAAAVAPLTPGKFLEAGDDALRSVGLSRPKIAYGRGIAEAMLEGTLDTGRLDAMSDDAVVDVLTGLRGIGRWSAEIYMLFALGRPDIWPAEDLAIQEALRRLKNLEERPPRADSEEIVEAWRPWRGVAALFLWHYYRGAP